MNKILSILAVLALMFSLVACGNTRKDDDTHGQIEIENRDNVNNEIENEVENDFYSVETYDTYAIYQFIRLEENPTTGYSWQYKIDDESIAVVEEDEYVQDEAPDGMTGVGGVHTYRLAGISSGETKITFKYFRPWQDESTAVKEVTFELKVNENNEILVNSIEK